MSKTVDSTFVRDLKEGDKVTRMLGGQVPMPMTVTKVEEDVLWCDGDWKFNRDTGCEIDEDLGWDGVTVTGSFLVRPD